MPGRLLPLQEHGDVTMTQRLWTSRPSRKRLFAPISTCRMARPGPQARLVVLTDSRDRDGRACRWRVGIDEVPAMPCRCPPPERPSSCNPVRFVQRMRPSGSTQQKVTGACSRNSTISSSDSGGRSRPEGGRSSVPAGRQAGDDRDQLGRLHGLRGAAGSRRAARAGVLGARVGRQAAAGTDPPCCEGAGAAPGSAGTRRCRHFDVAQEHVDPLLPRTSSASRAEETAVTRAL